MTLSEFLSELSSFISRRDVSVAANGAWAAWGLWASVMCHWLLLHGRKNRGPAATLEVLYWARFPGLLLAIHRLYWNFAIFLRDREAFPVQSYHPGMVELSWILFFAIIGIIYTGYRAMRPLVDEHVRFRLFASALITILLFVILSVLFV